jgi:microcompartment protein CcmK/EutM
MPTMSPEDVRVATVASPAGERVRPDLPDTPARRLRDAAEAVATVSWWGRPVSDRMAALGLDRLAAYVWGRAAPMGEPTAAVVVAAFGVFEPRVVTSGYESGRAGASRADVLAAREDGVIETLGRLLGDADVSRAVFLLRQAVDPLSRDLAGRPLFAGQLSLGWPADQLGQLWHGCTLLREYRGDVHVAANVAAGLSGVEMSLLTERWIGWAPTEYASTRGWTAEAMVAADAALATRGLVVAGQLTEEGRLLRNRIESQTDSALQPAVDALGSGVGELVELLSGWSAALVAAGSAPADPYKRLTG